MGVDWLSYMQIFADEISPCLARRLADLAAKGDIEIIDKRNDRFMPAMYVKGKNPAGNYELSEIGMGLEP